MQKLCESVQFLHTGQTICEYIVVSLQPVSRYAYRTLSTREDSFEKESWETLTHIFKG